MDRRSFREALLSVMDRKHHWSWRAFERGLVPRDKLHVHFEQEYATYVRDFPIFLGRAYVQCPEPEVRRELAENLYEEETGKLSLGRPHAELFLLFPEGLGMNREAFDHVRLLPEAARYRAFLDEATLERGWEVATAVTTIFVEGTRHDRHDVEGVGPARPTPPLIEHPLVRHYGLPVDKLELTRAHRMVESDHRAAAWRMVLGHVGPDAYADVVEAMEQALDRWLGYREGVAAACGLTRPLVESPA